MCTQAHPCPLLMCTCVDTHERSKKEGRGKEGAVGDSRAGGGTAALEQRLIPPATCAARHPNPWEPCLACRAQTELPSLAVTPYSNSSLSLQWKSKTSWDKGWQMSMKGMSALADKSLQTMGLLCGNSRLPGRAGHSLTLTLALYCWVPCLWVPCCGLRTTSSSPLSADPSTGL